MLKSTLIFMLVSRAYSSTFIELARNLEAPPETVTDGGETENMEYWEKHSNLLRNAWKEWESPASLSEWRSALNTDIRKATEKAWSDPRQEGHIRELSQEVIPNAAFSVPFFDPDRVDLIRRALQKPLQAEIPIRRPNGMNRYGIIIDPETDGAVHDEVLNSFCRELVDDFVRPIGRLFFPEYFSLAEDTDSDSYSFTINYKQGQDVLLKEHSDASTITLNINLGSTKVEDSPDIYIIDGEGGYKNVTFGPGMAVLHRGMLRHGAYRISENDERMNLVVWLFGNGGYVRALPFSQDSQMTQADRWRRSSQKPNLPEFPQSEL